MANTRNSKKVESARRKLLKTLMVGGGAVTASKLLPEQWARPVVGSVMLPAHAGLSTCATEIFSFFSDPFIYNFDGVLTSTVPPFFSGTLSGSLFSVTGTGPVPCDSGSGMVVVTGTADGPFTGSQNVYCDGTLVGTCDVSGTALYTNDPPGLILAGSGSCTVCEGFLYASTMDTIR